MSRTKKQPLTGSKAVDPSCRNHGTCPHCQANRKHKAAKQAPAVDVLDKLEATRPTGKALAGVFRDKEKK